MFLLSVFDYNKEEHFMFRMLLNIDKNDVVFRLFFRIQFSGMISKFRKRLRFGIIHFENSWDFNNICKTEFCV